MLDLDIDPKLAWALKNRHLFPVDVNRADREMLLRVPGLGARAVDRIIAARRHTTLRLDDVGRLTSALKRARAFLVALDHHPSAQLDAAQSAAAPRREAAAAEPVRMRRGAGAAHRVVLKDGADLDGFRRALRGLLSPRASRPTTWCSHGTDAPDLFGDATRCGCARRSRLPQRVGELIGLVVCHRDPERYALLYRLVWRVLHGERAASRRGERSARPSARPDGAHDPPRSPQDARLPALSPRRGRGSRALRRLVRARPLHPGGNRALLRRPLPLPRLDDPDAHRLDAVGSRQRSCSARRRGGRMRRRATGSRRAGAITTRASSIPRGSTRRPCAPRCRKNTGATCRRPPPSRR